jgi:hypothetical protein
MRLPGQEALAVTIRTPVVVGWWLASVLVVGCHSGTDTLTPVKGKVTYKGNLLTSGTVAFIPDGNRGTQGKMAVGEIQPDGTFVLKTGDSVGVVPGHHRVTIACLRLPAASLTSAAAGFRLPAKYGDPQQSGLVGEVLANTSNTISFELD